MKKELERRGIKRMMGRRFESLVDWTNAREGINRQYAYDLCTKGAKQK